MEEMIRLIVTQKGRTRAASFYLSILIAYLEEQKWPAAEKIVCLLEKMPLLADESLAFAYLSVLAESQDVVQIMTLASYLGDC